MADLSRNEDSALKGGTGRVTCPRLLPPTVARHCSSHLSACPLTGQATSAPSWPVSMLVLHIKTTALVAVHLPLSARSHRERQLTNAEEDTRFVLSIHLPMAMAQQEPGDANTASQQRHMQGAITPHRLLPYPQYPIRICQQMALIICLTCHPSTHFLKLGDRRWDIPVPACFLPFTLLSHNKGYNFSRVHILRETGKVRRRWAEMFLSGRKGMA